MAKHMVKCLYCGQMFDANIEPFVKPNARRYALKHYYGKEFREEVEEAYEFFTK